MYAGFHIKILERCGSRVFGGDKPLKSCTGISGRPEDRLELVRRIESMMRSLNVLAFLSICREQCEYLKRMDIMRFVFPQSFVISRFLLKIATQLAFKKEQALILIECLSRKAMLPLHRETLTSTKWSYELREGDHIAVWVPATDEKTDMGYYHHGIYFGATHTKVAHFPRMSKTHRPCVVDAADFLSRSLGYVRVLYEEEDEESRQKSIRLAQYFIDTPGAFYYDLFTTNCEYFATFCKTGERRCKQQNVSCISSGCTVC